MSERETDFTTHASVNAISSKGTRIIANPVGYGYPISEINKLYNPGLVVTV
jgi:hypothetical protein